MHPTPSHFILEVLPKIGIVTTCKCGAKRKFFFLFYFGIVQYIQKNYDGPIKLAPCKNKN
jgi:hypothetical protein